MEQRDLECLIRRAIAGLDILVVGGDHRPQATKRLEAQLHLRSAQHCPTRRSDPTAACYQRALREPDLVLVVCVRGLCRTQHGKDLHDHCRWLDLPLLDQGRIPHPNQLVASLAHCPVGLAVLKRAEVLRAHLRGKGGAA